MWMSFNYPILLFLLLVALPTKAQQGNPFDIERPKPVRDTFQINNGDNIFDVQRLNRDTIKPISADTIVQELEPEITEAIRSIDDGSNPFEVDHVPIRKRDIQEKREKVKLAKKPASSNLFVFWLTLFSLIILAIVLNTQKSTLPNLFKSLTNENILKMNKREESGGTSAVYLLLYSIFFLGFSAFMYLVFAGLELFSSGIISWFYILLGLITIYLCRHIAMYILGTFFPVGKESSLYNFTIISFNLVIGLVLIPINLLLAFGPESFSNGLMYTGLIVFSLVFLLRLLRGLFIAIPYLASNTFHFLLYLCAFEIAPILLLYKEFVLFT